jgi:hypothetical protein
MEIATVLIPLMSTHDCLHWLRLLDDDAPIGSSLADGAYEDWAAAGASAAAFDLRVPGHRARQRARVCRTPYHVHQMP